MFRLSPILIRTLLAVVATALICAWDGMEASISEPQDIEMVDTPSGEFCRIRREALAEIATLLERQRQTGASLYRVVVDPAVPFPSDRAPLRAVVRDEHGIRLIRRSRAPGLA